MKKTNLMTAALIAIGMGFSMAYAEETTMEKADVAKDKAVDGVKSGYREVKDKVCETIDGKLKCLPKKIKSKAKDISDDVKTEVKEIKNKGN